MNHTSNAVAVCRPSPDSIALRAYELFQERGGHNGNDMEDWLLAEAELLYRVNAQILTPCSEVAAQSTARITVSDIGTQSPATRSAPKAARSKR